jgi:serine/threonine protein kinase
LFLKAYEMLDVSIMVSFFKEYIRERIMNEPEREKPPEIGYRKGDFIDGYFEVAKVLGKGGFGIVYLVYLGQGQGKEVFALKTIRDEYLKDSEAKERFRKEAEIWVGLEKHPFLVRADFVFWVSGTPFIVIEYITPNCNIHSFLKLGNRKFRSTC